MEQNLIFSSLEDNSNGVLGNEDLRFFYYDVGLETLSGTPIIYEDDEEIESFKDSRKLTIKSIEQDKLPSSFQDGHIYFVMDNCDKTDIDSFFRHLRNAFSHYHIKRNHDYFLIKDYYNNGNMTMIGKITCNDLKELCYLYFKQQDKLPSIYEDVI